MFGSQILEVVIGLTLIYLVLSIGCSGAKEVIANLFSLRSKTLESAIRNMLKAGPSDYATKLFQHPLITGTAPAGEKPSYISSRLFAAALFDVLVPADPTQARTVQSLRAGVSQIPDEKLRGTLLNIIDSAGGDMDKARTAVENWFNDSMDRISGWYKRMAQKIILAVALLLCIAVNADTLMIVKELWSDQALRSAAVASAEKRVQAGKPAQTDSSGAAASSTDDQTAQLKKAATDIRDINALPIGWKCAAGDIRALPSAPLAWFLKVLGILLSSFAVCMGAPFWFDMLNNIVNLRVSGNPPKTQ
ncbi:MAG: hypothetical protein ACHQT6_01735 [Candidatus Acidiferrales bacterium]